MKIPFEFGYTRVKPQVFGDWEIKEFAVTKHQAECHNLRYALKGCHDQFIESGSFLKLMQISSGHTVMSNNKKELLSNRVAFENAQGCVLVAGLGMGLILEAMLSKPEVTHIRVVEKDAEIIKYVGSFFKNEPRVEIVHGDIFAYKLDQSEMYDYVWLDIWDDINVQNISEFKVLNEKFSGYGKRIDIWSMDLLGSDQDIFEKD